MNKALVAVVVIVMECVVGCGPPHNTLYLRDELQPFCRENDALVLASSCFSVGGAWRLRERFVVLIRNRGLFSFPGGV